VTDVGDTFSLPMRAAAPSGQPSSYGDKETIDRLLASSDPTAVTSAGKSYQKFAAAYEKIGAELLGLRGDLHEAWGGKGAAAAQSQLREAWSTATSLHQNANNFGSALERHGSEYLAWYKNSKPPSKTDSEAQQWMTGANERIVESWGEFPQHITTTLPAAPGVRGGHDPASIGQHGRPSVSARSSRSISPGAGSVDGGSHGHSHLGGGNSAHPNLGNGGADLAGLLPSGSSGGGITGGTLGPGNGPGSFPGGVGTPGSPLGPVTGPGLGPGPFPGGIGSGGRLPGGGQTPDSLGRRGRALGTPGAGATEEAAAAEANAARTAAVRQGMPGPMLGGAEAGREEQERTRETWLAEDQETWTGNADVAPPVIGATGKAPDMVERLPDSKDDTAALSAELQAELGTLEVDADGVEAGPSADELLYGDWDIGMDV
jgi:uncharacterized protein YukE